MPAGVAALLREGHEARIGERDPEGRSSSPLYVANQWLVSEARELQDAQVRRAFDEQAIRDHAENYARLCSRMRSLESRMSFALYVGVEPPAGKSCTPSGAAARLDDPLWWRRQLRKRWTRSAENSMRALGVVRKGREPYASDEAVRHRAAQKRRAKGFLESSVAVCETGEQLSLLELAEKSLANPALRRGEFMCRCRGFEHIAEDLKHSALFVTVTTPGTFHAQLSKGGRNPDYKRQLVRDAQQWLCGQWARARAKLKRLSVTFYGFRIAEPHHDATPHWHLLLFVKCSRTQRGLLRRVLKFAFITSELTTRRAQAARLKIIRIDRTRGNATGYVAKYVSKNIDGAGAINEAEDKETGERVAGGVARVDAWASIHGIRQFQQVGGAPVGLWREARRLTEPVGDADIERARSAADRGDWRAFSYAVHPEAVPPGRKTALRLEKVEDGTVNRYGEHRPARVIGLRYASAVAITRPHRWRIERKASETTAPTKGGSIEPRPQCQNARQKLGSPASSSSVFSPPLGPVAITVRERDALMSESPHLAWVATVPFRAAGPP